MRHGRSVLAGVSAVVLLWAAGEAVPTAGAAHAPRAAVDRSPARIPLPDGWQPEGITTDQERLYVGSLANGALWKANPRTGVGKVLWPGARGSMAVGVDYDRTRNLIWVAGGGTGEVRVHDVRSGELQATYTFDDAAFINDLTVTPRGVYATDSMRPVLLVVPLDPPDADLPAPGSEMTVPLTGDYEHVPDEFNLNGIEAVAGRAVVAIQSVTGNLYAIERDTGAATLLEVAETDLTSGDGLERRGEVVYVVRNFFNEIIVLEQTGASGDGTPSGYRRIGAMTSNSFRIPTTVAAARGQLYAVNARFRIEEPRPATRYWITRLQLLR